MEGLNSIQIEENNSFPFDLQTGINAIQVEDSSLTPFDLHVGFNSISIEPIEKQTYFELLKGFNGLNTELLRETYFSLQTGFNSVGVEGFLFRGRIEYPEGVPYTETGTVTVFNILTNEFYSFTVSGGSFTFQSYIDDDFNFSEILLGYRDSNFRGAIIIPSPSESEIYTIILSEVLTMAVKASSRVLPARTSGVTTSLFFNDGCCYEEMVFANFGENWWENDRSSFLLKKILSTDTIVFKLYKNDIFVNILDNPTYGVPQYFDMYTGFQLEWQKVWLENGSGCYQIKAEMNLAGLESVFESQSFNLSRYSEMVANNTVRIESYQTGTILRSGFNYDELGLNNGWYASYRIKGKFGNKKPSYETDVLLTSNRRLLQIQDSIKYEYSLQTLPIPSNIAKVLIEDTLLANQILISDYSLSNTEVFRRVEVAVNSISDVKTYDSSKNVIYEITFGDRQPNIIKRN